MHLETRHPTRPARKKVTITLPASLLASMKPRGISRFIEEAITEKRHRDACKGLMSLRGSLKDDPIDWRKIRDEEWEDEKAQLKRWGFIPPDWEEVE